MAIPTQNVANHHVGTVHEDIAMGMRAEDFSHIQFMFDNLYSRPIEAVEREYATNAWDSHVFAGVSRPIEITLPTVESMEFVVQDYGLGMSIDTLREVYAFYGNSDKRESNAVAGQLGVGSKSGLSYAAGFTVTAVKDHEKVSAFVTKDKHGNGVIKILTAPAATNEPNGVRIAIPVDRYDVPTFHAYAENLFQFWAPGTVLIDGNEPEVPEWRANALPLDEWNHTLLVRQDQGLDSSYVIMGNVPYPVPDVTIGRTNTRFVATLNIGDVDFAPSREDVRHTKHTDDTLAELHDYIRGSFKRAIATALTGVTSRWEEAMLKVLWMDRNTRIDATGDNPIWWFGPNVSWGRKSKAHLRYALSALSAPALVAITGFTAKNVSTAARDRLTDFAQSKGINKPTFIIFPEKSATGVLDGRPNTFAWGEVVGATALPKAEKKARQARDETVYSIYGGAGMIGDDLAALTGKVLYVNPGDYVSHGTLGATIVVPYSSAQLPRITRFVPGIEHYSVELERQTRAAAVAVTDEDRKIRKARTLPQQYHGLDPDKVLDSDLADALRLRKTPDTATLTDADKFGVDVKAGSLANKFEKRYPLLHTGNHYYASHYNTPAISGEVLLYVNAKFADSQPVQLAS